MDYSVKMHLNKSLNFHKVDEIEKCSQILKHLETMKIKEQRKCKNITLFALRSEIIQRIINIKGKKTQIDEYVGRKTNYREGMETIH